MNIVHGDILSNISSDTFTVICHQTNCRGVAGAGLAKAIRERFPNWYNAYRLVASPDMLGNAQFTPTDDSFDCVICNLYGQLNLGRDRRYTDYNALRHSLQTLRHWLNKLGITEDYEIRLPYGLGCGLAGGSWDVVSVIIEETLHGLNYKIYKL